MTVSVASGNDHRARWQTTAPEGEQLLPRAHRAVSNLKAWLHALPLGVTGATTAYLDEYVFRHNRRGNPHAAFQTLLGLSTHHQPNSYPEIIDHAACKAQTEEIGYA